MSTSVTLIKNKIVWQVFLKSFLYVYKNYYRNIFYKQQFPVMCCNSHMKIEYSHTVFSHWLCVHS